VRWKKCIPFCGKFITETINFIKICSVVEDIAENILVCFYASQCISADTEMVLNLKTSLNAPFLLLLLNNNVIATR